MGWPYLSNWFNKSIFVKYYVYDEDGCMIRCFRWKHEAITFLQEGWTIQVKKVVKRDGYSEALLLGEAWI